MAHLSNHGLPCPKPIANLDNRYLGALNGKPAALVTCLTGAPITDLGWHSRINIHTHYFDPCGKHIANSN